MAMERETAVDLEALVVEMEVGVRTLPMVLVAVVVEQRAEVEMVVVLMVAQAEGGQAEAGLV